MPNVAIVLKAEIARIARREIRLATAKTRKATVQARKTLAAIRRQIGILEKAQKAVAAKVEALPVPAAEPAEKAARMWVTSKGIVALRRKLKLTQARFAKLVGVTPQSVNLWEHKGGTLKLRKATRDAIAAARSLGIRDARAKLGPAAKPPKAARKAKRAARVKPTPKPASRRRAGAKRRRAR
jgi:DNA-binding transcriptional regulator YiaG